jgi:hypothetical protein
MSLHRHLEFFRINILYWLEKGTRQKLQISKVQLMSSMGYSEQKKAKWKRQTESGFSCFSSLCDLVIVSIVSSFY